MKGKAEAKDHQTASKPPAAPAGARGDSPSQLSAGADTADTRTSVVQLSESGDNATKQTGPRPLGSSDSRAPTISAEGDRFLLAGFQPWCWGRGLVLRALLFRALLSHETQNVPCSPKGYKPKPCPEVPHILTPSAGHANRSPSSLECAPVRSESPSSRSNFLLQDLECVILSLHVVVQKNVCHVTLSQMQEGDFSIVFQESRSLQLSIPGHSSALSISQESGWPGGSLRLHQLCHCLLQADFQADFQAGRPRGRLTFRPPAPILIARLRRSCVT